MPNKSTARRHHFVPQAYLAGFTDTGTKNGQMYVMEAETRRSFRTSPKNIAVEKDFNRIDVDGYPLDYIENTLSPLEGSAVQAISRISDSTKFPSDTDYSAILHLMALLFIRNPKLRKSFNRSREHETRILSDLLVSSEATFNYQMAKARESGEDIPENVSYEEMRRFIKSGAYEIEFHPQSNLKVELNILETTVHRLHERSWSLLLASTGTPDFICSDHPVTLVHKSHRNTPIGLATRNTVLFFPLTRRLGFYGVFEEKLKPVIEAPTKKIAILNDAVASNAMKHIYSAKNEFVVWIDKAIQTVQMVV